MAGTRSSARVAAKQQATPSPSSQGSPTAGSKRKADPASSPKDPKRGKKEKEDKPSNVKDLQPKVTDYMETPEPKTEEAPQPETKPSEEKTEKATEAESGEKAPVRKEEEKTDTEPSVTNGGAVEEDPKREKAMPSSILEKGIIYFFTRGRVGVEDPQSVKDLQRTYFVLRPLPDGAKLTDGPIDDAQKSRLLALPKKTFPTSHRERYMAFVEKGQASVKDLKENFLKGESHETQTSGTRTTPNAFPIGEGIYALTSTGRESHLTYILTRPESIGELQKEMGLRSRASFIVSIKNPEAGGPSYATLPKGAEYPKEIMDEFRGRGWMQPITTRALDYPNAQILLIGEAAGDTGKATEQQPADQRNGKDDPLEQLEQLEHEDELRVEHLKGDDPVLEDLGLSAKEYSSIATTW